jgi:hypothetical protein
LFTDRNINTTSPLTGSGNLSSDITLGISLANAGTNGYLSNTDWTTFNNKLSSTPVGASGQLIYNNGTTYAGATGLSYISGNLSGYEKQSNKDQPSGYAGLDASGNLLATSIIPRAGTATGINAIVLDNGEIATTSDTHKIRIGDGSRAGGWEIGGTTIYRVTIPSGDTYQIPNGRDVLVNVENNLYAATGTLLDFNDTILMPDINNIQDGDRVRVFVNRVKFTNATNYVISLFRNSPSGWLGYSFAPQDGFWGSQPSGFGELYDGLAIAPTVINKPVYIDMTLMTDFYPASTGAAYDGGLYINELHNLEIQGA